MRTRASDHRHLFVLSARGDDQLGARDPGPLLPTLGTAHPPMPSASAGQEEGSEETAQGCSSDLPVSAISGAGGPLRNTWGAGRRGWRGSGPGPLGARARCGPEAAQGAPQPHCHEKPGAQSPGSAHVCTQATRTPALWEGPPCPSRASLLLGEGEACRRLLTGIRGGGDTTCVLAGVGSRAVQSRCPSPSLSASRGPGGLSGPDRCLSTWPPALPWSPPLCRFCRRVSLYRRVMSLGR